MQSLHPCGSAGVLKRKRKALIYWLCYRPTNRPTTDQCMNRSTHCMHYNYEVVILLVTNLMFVTETGFCEGASRPGQYICVFVCVCGAFVRVWVSLMASNDCNVLHKFSTIPSCCSRRAVVDPWKKGWLNCVGEFLLYLTLTFKLPNLRLAIVEENEKKKHPDGMTRQFIDIWKAWKQLKETTNLQYKDE